MKKKMIALLAGALMTSALAGNAFAAFGDLHLYRVVYNSSNKVELGTDLGTFSMKNELVGNLDLGRAIDTTKLGNAASDFTNLKVAYFAVDTSAAADLWLSSKNDAAGTLNTGAKWTPIKNNFMSINNTYKNSGLDEVVAQSTSASSNTYYSKYDGFGANVGIFTQFLKAGQNMESVFTNGVAEQNLIFFDNTNVTGAGTQQIAKIRTTADGTTLLGSEPVPTTPIPPAFLLMGSGLLGLVGIRRKSQK